MRVVFRSQVFRDVLPALAQPLGLDMTLADDETAFARALPAADALWIAPTYYDAPVAALLARSSERLRWIGLPSVGYDALIRHGVPPHVAVTNTGGAMAPTVAEHALALLLALLRELPRSARRQTEHRWDNAGFLQHVRSLEETTLAIVGFGAIGREIARRARPFGARIVGVSRRGAPNTLADEIYPRERLPEALARCDAAIVAVPMNAETRHLIDAEALAALPPHAVLINVARGPIVARDALAAALRERRLAGAALDVTEPEPLPSDDPLWEEPRLLITPHVAGFGGAATPRRIAELFTRNVAHLRAGEPLEALVEIPPRP